ncbi:hypothetical protein KDAU_37510 [Dictyobacter aurantiacus]|uniref:Uncharacterized protein n=2 Tax=Dictyobacter aurantiacus TaxID=1936993 RepID=A0A401ZHV1_9CHLR|nr:hypothetical protein KDAU_37510 [Dictyobacter aurantiacus]
MAMSYGMEIAMDANQRPSRHMPFFMPAQSMAASANATTTILKTDVITSVSLFVLIPLLLLVTPVIGLVVLISLLISLLLMGLTGLIGLESLVGRIVQLATRNAQGD